MWLYGVRWAHFSCFQELMGQAFMLHLCVDTLYCHEMEPISILVVHIFAFHICTVTSLLSGKKDL